MAPKSAGDLEPRPASTSTLCHGCFRLFYKHKNAQRLVTDGFTVFHRTWEELCFGREKGCQLCLLITSSIKDIERRTTEAIDTSSGRQITFKFGKGREDRLIERLRDLEHLDVQIRVRDEGDWQWETLDDMTLTVVEGNPAAKYINRRPTIYDFASDSSCEMAREWMTECDASHQDCPRLKAGPLPTRVIEVGDSRCDQQKLLITNGVSEHYVALSYCWGMQPQPLVTTESNIDNLCHDIPASSLPQTIEDAILITRKLGFRYLWVDALCILQDSAVDKAREITRMGEVYQSAAITLVSASARSCQEGFLHRRSYPWADHAWQTFNLPFRCTDGSLGELTLEPRDTYYTGDQPINHRAWTLQESLLSPRKLIYSTTPLVWQCQSNETILGSRARKPDSRAWRSMSIQLSRVLTAAKYDSTYQDMLQAVHRNWISILQAYSRRKLTNSEDILPAISAIAAKFGVFLNEQYKAGHWYNPSNKSDFARDLLWYRENSYKGPSIENGSAAVAPLYTAPSWSWACRQDTVWWVIPMRLQGEVLCEVDECMVELATAAATYGQVKSGFLRLRAQTRRLEKAHEGNDDGEEDLACLISLLDVKGVKVCLDDDIEILAKRLVLSSASSAAASVTVLCVLLTEYGGLLVLPQSEGKWVRIGMFQDDDRMGLDPGQSFKGWFEDKRFEIITII